ncbi:MAG: hypothetical protein AAFP77_12440 [Bacteroidota bacterium]
MFNNLPNNIYQLAGVLGVLLFIYVFYAIIKEVRRINLKPGEPFRILKILIYVGSAFALIVIYLLRPPKPPHVACEECEAEIVTYLQDRTRLVKCVESGSSAYYYLKGTDSFEGVEKLEIYQLKHRIEEAKISLQEVIEKFNLQSCQ